MEKMLKIDTHVHSKGISRCSLVDCKTIVDAKKKLGYDGAILTNHCQPWYYPPEEHKNYIERVIEEYRKGKKYADEQGFRLYLGLEVTLFETQYTDWLLFGATEEFLRKTPCLYQCTQKELFELCDGNGVLLVQAHPCRREDKLGNPNYMHGVELNGTPCDLPTFPHIREFAKANGLLLSCGTDYHNVDRTYMGGIYLPEKCEKVEDIVKYICENKGITLFTEEGDETVFVEK